MPATLFTPLYRHGIHTVLTFRIIDRAASLHNQDIALLDRRQIELCRDTFPHIHTQDSVVRRALWQIARSCTILECDIQMPGRTFAEA